MQTMAQSGACDGLMRMIAAKRERDLAPKTREKWQKVLALKEDPVNDWNAWGDPLEKLAVAVNHKEADLSVFENLKRASELRQKAFLEKQNSSLTTLTKAERKRKSIKRKKAKKEATSALMSESEKPASIPSKCFRLQSSDLVLSSFLIQHCIPQTLGRKLTSYRVRKLLIGGSQWRALHCCLQYRGV